MEQEDENGEVTDHWFVAAEDDGHEMQLQLCQADGSKGESKGLEVDEEGELKGQEEYDEETDRQGRVAELWCEDDDCTEGGVDDRGRAEDCGHDDVGKTCGPDGAEDYDDNKAVSIGCVSDDDGRTFASRAAGRTRTSATGKPRATPKKKTMMKTMQKKMMMMMTTVTGET